MESQYTYMSKLEIQHRMRKFAAEFFGMRHTELLDPVVNLFLESLSEEIYKTSGEIENIERRISDKLSAMLAPSVETIAHPAHCILHASSQEDITRITANDGFAYYDRNSREQYSFYPVCDTSVFNAKVSYFIHKGLIQSVDWDFSRTLHGRSDRQSYFEDSACWVGLELDDHIQDISGLSFFFDLHTISNKDKYLTLIPYSTWSIRREEISIVKGLCATDVKHENATLDLFSRYDLSNRINHSVITYYRNHFITIAEHCPVEEKKEVFPEELRPYFTQSVLAKMSKPLVWIKMVFPKGFSADVIYSLQFGINLFPVINKELVSAINGVSKAAPVIPLKTGCNESFIAVNKVTDSDGTEYYDIPVNSRTEKNKAGIYALRRGGIERYSHRDANEYITNIIHVLNAESSSFSKNKESVKSDFIQIQNDIRLLIRQLNKALEESKDRYETENYLLVNADKDDRIYFVEYWITHAAALNRLKAGIPFISISGLALSPLSLFSLTPTVGGKYAPQAEQKNELRKKMMTKHHLLVTDQDIINFCMCEFQESVSKVEIRKGIIQSDNPAVGFVRTIDVYMKLNKNMEKYVDKKDEAYFKETLVENSPGTYTYRVFIEQIVSN